jgi:diguanylate cyclase (GGDEF)-like protein
VYLAVGVAAVLSYVAGPAWLRDVVFTAVLLLGFAGLVTGTLRNAAPGGRRPWWCLLGVQVLFVVSILVRQVIPGAANIPPPPVAIVPDLLVVPGYLLMTYSYLSMLRQRRGGDDDSARVDAVLVGLGAAFAMWTFLVAPQLDDPTPSVMLLVNSLFPVFDVVLLVVVAQLLMADGVRQPALWLLVACSGALFTGDLIYALRTEERGPAAALAIDVTVLCAMLLPGAAALHPSMRTVTEPQQVRARDLSAVRTALIAVVLVTPPVTVTLAPATNTWNRLVQAALCILVTMAALARIVSANNSRARAERSSRWRATHDDLTDLPNRGLLVETITRWGERATGEGQEISLIFIDLDHFKMVNDHWGHEVGDELLCVVAGRLGAMVRGEDLVCRIGGDEFVVALASPSHAQLAESLARRVIAEFSTPFELSVGGVIVTPSIGIAHSSGAAQALELIRDADTAMYKAKGSGRNAYVTFDASLRERVQVRMELEQALRGALARGELSVHYQPIIDLATGELDGFEALMRWHSPRFGAVSPLDFIPIAEDTGLIVQSGSWLLREAAAQLAAWQAGRPADARPLHISVNVSVRQLRDGELVEVVRDVLAGTGLAPDSIWLEITESGLMEDVSTALETLHELRALGVVLSIDDFGTGYSSLSYLSRLPVGILKIDRSFVAGVGTEGATEPIVRAVLAMTRAMGLRVVAEGVETPVQRDWLRARGCELAQGWLYGPARPPDALDDWISRRPGAQADGAR